MLSAMAPAPVVTPLARTVLDRLVATYGAAADQARAVAMRAYMRDQFDFLGIQSPQQRLLSREVLAGLGSPAEQDLRDIALGAWDLAEREFQYFACGVLRRHVRVCSAEFVGTAEHLVVTKPWWDTVDALASRVVGPLVRQHPSLVATMDAWIADENLWRIRTALLHQLSAKEATDADRLFRYCVAQAGHRDFFVRKAIGWALREYARTDPAAVGGFVRAHERRLSPLSVREAMKNL
jgi:3-methyladenine DNA glycosylase AlkD